MKWSVITQLATLVVLFTGAAKPVFALSSGDVLNVVNEVRKEQNLTSFTTNSKLEQAAYAKLADIQQYKYWNHNNPVTKTDWKSFIKQTGYRGLIGENLAMNLHSGNDVVNAWLNSPTHKSNLLSQGFTEVGMAIGDVVYPEGTKTVVVMEFGKSATVKTKILSWVR